MAKRRKPVNVETTELCNYGCGNIAKFKSPYGILICECSVNKCPANREKNSNGIKKLYESGRDAKVISRNMSEDAKKRQAWAKGLTKDTHPGIAKTAIETSLRLRGKPGHKVSESVKEILSIRRIEYLENSPHVKWKMLPNGLKVQGEWEYNVGLRLLEAIDNLKRIKLKYDGHRHCTFDFCIAENVFVEVKGWLSNRDKLKYNLVYKDHPNIKVYIIRNEYGKNNYTKFINGEIKLEECEDLYEVLMGD